MFNWISNVDELHNTTILFENRGKIMDYNAPVNLNFLTAVPVFHFLNHRPHDPTRPLNFISDCFCQSRVRRSSGLLLFFE